MKNRPERLISFLVVWLTMFSCIWVSGQIPRPWGPGKDFLQLKYPGDLQGQMMARPSSGQAENRRSAEVFDDNPMDAISNFRVNSMHGITWSPETIYAQAPDLYYMQSGFFCKREWELEKAIHIPLRFRLGSLADCNALEGKH